MKQSEHLNDGEANFSIAPDDLAIVVKPNGSIQAVVGKRNLAEIGLDATAVNVDANGYTRQAQLFMSMIVTGHCEPLIRAALELVGDKSVINFNRLKEPRSVH